MGSGCREIFCEIKQRRGEVKTSPGLEQSVLARRHETRGDRVKLQGERKGETEGREAVT